MKKILIIAFFTLCIFNLSISQPPAAGTYVVNNNVDKFEGTWKCVSGSDEIIIKLKKFRHTVSNYDEDILLGSHSYKHNGIVIESSLGDFDAIPNNHKKKSVYVWNNPMESANKVLGIINDLSKHTSFYIYIEYVVGANPEQLIVQIKDKNQFLTEPNQQLGNTLPTNFILTRQ